MRKEDSSREYEEPVTLQEKLQARAENETSKRLLRELKSALVIKKEEMIRRELIARKAKELDESTLIKISDDFVPSIADTSPISSTSCLHNDSVVNTPPNGSTFDKVYCYVSNSDNDIDSSDEKIIHFGDNLPLNYINDSESDLIRLKSVPHITQKMIDNATEMDISTMSLDDFLSSEDDITLDQELQQTKRITNDLNHLESEKVDTNLSNVSICTSNSVENKYSDDNVLELLSIESTKKNSSEILNTREQDDLSLDKCSSTDKMSITVIHTEPNINLYNPSSSEININELNNRNSDSDSEGSIDEELRKQTEVIKALRDEEPEVEINDMNRSYLLPTFNRTRRSKKYAYSSSRKYKYDRQQGDTKYVGRPSLAQEAAAKAKTMCLIADEECFGSSD